MRDNSRETALPRDGGSRPGEPRAVRLAGACSLARTSCIGMTVARFAERVGAINGTNIKLVHKSRSFKNKELMPLSLFHKKIH